MGMRLYERVLKPFEMRNGPSFLVGWVLFADVPQTAEGSGIRKEQGYSEFFVADSDVQKISAPQSPGAGYPVVGEVKSFGERPTRDGVRRRAQLVFWRMLSAADKSELMADPACPFRFVTSHQSGKLFSWTPTTEFAKAAFARFEAYVDREHAKIERRYVDKKSAAELHVQANLAAFARDADRLEAEAAELAARAARMREQSNAARKIKTQAQLETEAAGSGRSATAAKAELQTRAEQELFDRAHQRLEKSFQGVNEIFSLEEKAGGYLSPIRKFEPEEREALRTLMAQGQDAVRAKDTARVHTIADEITKALEPERTYEGGARRGYALVADGNVAIPTV